MSWKNEPELTRSHLDSDAQVAPEISSESVQLKNEKKSDANLTVNADTINTSLLELIKELKRKRRYGFILKFIGWFVIVGLLASLLTGQHKQIIGDHAAVVKLDGIIADGYDASAENVLAGLKSAFEAQSAKGVILAINSPGGSPVQADMLYQEIQRLKQHYNKPMVAVISDLGASGGYYAAVAAEKIYANPSSIVGSIGVLMNGFGFVELMDKIGVERRLLTAGENKGTLDPFSPLKDNELEHVESVIDGVHQQFIDVVRESRGERLKENDALFSGQFWNGQQAYDLGLTDGFKTHWAAARDDFGQETIVDYTLRPDVLERFTETLGVSIAKYLNLSLNSLVPKMQ